MTRLACGSRYPHVSGRHGLDMPQSDGLHTAQLRLQIVIHDRSIFSMFRTLISAALLSAASVIPAGAQDAAETEAPARIANGQRFGSWTLSCQAIAMNETSCILEQTLMRSSDNAFLARLLAFWTPDGEKAVLAAQAPLGVHLPSGFVFRVGESEDVSTMTWQTCNQNICEAVIELDEALLDQVSAPETPITASYLPPASTEPVVFRLSMDGLKEGLEALKPAAPAAE